MYVRREWNIKNFDTKLSLCILYKFKVNKQLQILSNNDLGLKVYRRHTPIQYNFQYSSLLIKFWPIPINFISGKLDKYLLSIGIELRIELNHYLSAIMTFINYPIRKTALTHPKLLLNPISPIRYQNTSGIISDVCILILKSEKKTKPKFVSDPLRTYSVANALPLASIASSFLWTLA